MEFEVVLNTLERQTNELKASKYYVTYLEPDNDVHFAHLLFIIVRTLCCCELSVESIRDDETDEDHNLRKRHNFEVLRPLPRAARDKVVAPLLDEPVEAAVEEQECQSKQLVDVESVPQHCGQEKKLEYFLLRFVHHISALDHANFAEEHPN